MLSNFSGPKYYMQSLKSQNRQRRVRIDRADMKLTTQFKNLSSLNIITQLLTLYILTGVFVCTVTVTEKQALGCLEVKQESRCTLLEKYFNLLVQDQKHPRAQIKLLHKAESMRFLHTKWNFPPPPAPYQPSNYVRLQHIHSQSPRGHLTDSSR